MAHGVRHRTGRAIGEDQGPHAELGTCTGAGDIFPPGTRQNRGTSAGGPYHQQYAATPLILGTGKRPGGPASLQSGCPGGPAR